MDNWASGIDVSRYQGTINWSAVKASGVLFAAARATVGTSYTDPQFSTNWNGMKANGIYRMAYHVIYPDLSPTVQIQHFTNVVGSDQGELPPVLDLELDRGLDNATLVQRTYACLLAMEQSFGRRPILYTSAGFWNTHMIVNNHVPAWTNTYDLWVANYTTAQSPTMPRGWTSWKFWQWSSTGTVPGINGSVDLDWFQGTPEELQAYATGTPAPPPPPPPPETILGKAKVIASPKINVRSSPAITATNDVGDLNRGCIVVVLEILQDGNNLWYRIGGPNLWVAARYQGRDLMEWQG
jgi:lysozyme